MSKICINEVVVSMDMGDNAASQAAKALNDDADKSHQPLVKKESSSSRHHHKKKPSALIVQVLPPSPKDCCTVCDPLCADDMQLAILTTFTCWLLLGIFPVIAGLFSIHYAKKAKSTDDEVLQEQYSSISRSISWVGMLLFTVCVTIAVIVLATCGIL